jgi:hypothetical protein
MEEEIQEVTREVQQISRINLITKIRIWVDSNRFRK